MLTVLERVELERKLAKWIASTACRTRGEYGEDVRRGNVVILRWDGEVWDEVHPMQARPTDQVGLWDKTFGYLNTGTLLSDL